jgi:serine/threonine-protein kinase
VDDAASSLPGGGHEELVGAVLAGRYRIERQLGRGGMGVVYAARQLDLSRRVAVKVLTASGGDLGALAHEARTAAGLAHPHIIQVTDFVEPADAPPFLVMELLEGESLDDRLAAKRTLSPDEAVKIAIQVLSALAAAHDAGIVHRDVKPANVFLTRTAVTYDFVKLLDFGVARVGNAASIAGLGREAPIGTPAYMAPEQIVDGHADARTDVYAVGVCLYEMLGGAAPFTAQNVPALLSKICSAEPRPLAELAPEVDPELAAVVSRAMSKDADERYASAEELRVALVPFASAMPVPSRALGEPSGTRGASRRVDDDAATIEAPPPAEALVGGRGAAASAPPTPPTPPASAGPTPASAASAPPAPSALPARSEAPPSEAPASAATSRLAGGAVAALAFALVAAGVAGARGGSPGRSAGPTDRTGAAALASPAAAPGPACELRDDYEALLAPVPLRLSIAGRDGWVVVAGEVALDRSVPAPLVAYARPGERSFELWSVPGLDGRGKPAWATALSFDGTVGVFGVKLMPAPRPGDPGALFELADRRATGLLERPFLRAEALLPTRAHAAASPKTTLVATTGPSRDWIAKNDAARARRSALAGGGDSTLDLTWFHEGRERSRDVDVAGEMSFVQAFAGDAVSGALVVGLSFEAYVVDMSDAHVASAPIGLPPVRSPSAVVAGDRVHVVWADGAGDEAERGVRWTSLNRGGMETSGGVVLAGQRARAFAAGSSEGRVVLAWVSAPDADAPDARRSRAVLHAGVGATIPAAASSLATLEVDPLASQLAVSVGGAETWLAWLEPEPERHLGSVVRVASLRCR